MPSTAMITDRLDDLESRLPVIPAKVLHFQRVVAGKSYDNYVATLNAVAESYKTFFETAVSSSRTVSEQARAAGEQIVSTFTNGIKAVADQAVAQSRKVSETAEGEVSSLVDSAIDAVEDAPGSGTPYEQWTKAELVERAKELDIVGPTRMSKQELIKALRAH
jgi:hypothetical protein